MSGSTRLLALALLLGLAVRVGTWGFLLGTPPAGDEVEYLARSAANIEGRDILGEGKRPPASIWYYTEFGKLTGLRGQGLRLANVLMSCLGIALLWMLARRVAGPRVAALAAFGTALYPCLVLYAPSYWSEPLYTAFLLGALVPLASDAPGIPAAIGAGILMAGATLTREVGVFLPALGAAALLGRGGWRRSRVWVRVLALGVAFAAVLTPWVIRQNTGEDTFALVSRTTWLNLYVGNAPPPEGSRADVRRAGGLTMYRAYDRLAETRDGKEAAAKKVALQAIRDRMPWWPFEKIAETMPDLLTPAPLPVGRLLNRPTDHGWRQKWAYRTAVDGTRFEWLRDAIAYTVVACWVLVALAGTAGLALWWGRPFAGVLVLVVAVHVVPVVISFAASRFRLPFVPILIVGAAWLAANGRESWNGASLWKRVLVVAAVALVAVAIGADWHELARPRWT